MAIRRKVVAWVTVITLLITVSLALAASQKLKFVWTGFTSGELSPLLEGQVSFDKYYAGAKTMTNFLPRPQGAASNRSGFRYLGATKNQATETSRLIPFVYSNDQAYALEFGDSYIRFWRDGELLQDTHANIKLLIHPENDEPDASQTFTDAAATPKVITAGGNVQQDDDVTPAIGDFAILFDGNGDFLSLADNADWNVSASDWAAGGFIRPDAGTDTPQVIFGQDDGTDYIKLTLEKYTGLLLNGNGTDMSPTISDSSMNTKTLTRDGATSFLLHGIDTAYERTEGSANHYDSSPTSHTITSSGTSDTPVIDTVTTKFGSSIVFDRDDAQYLSMADHADFDLSSDIFTIQGWLYISSSGRPITTQSLLVLGDVSGTDYMKLEFDLGNINANINVYSYNSPAIQTWTTSDLNSYLDKWFHFAVVADGTDLKIYADGTEVTSGTTTISTSFQDYNTTLYIGCDNNEANCFEGWLEGGDLLEVGIAGLLVDAHHHLALAGRYGDGLDLLREGAIGGGLLGALQRGDGKVVLRFARERILFGALFGEHTHQFALVVGIFEAIEKHMVCHLAMTHAQSGTRLG